MKFTISKNRSTVGTYDKGKLSTEDKVLLGWVAGGFPAAIGRTVLGDEEEPEAQEDVMELLDSAEASNVGFFVDTLERSGYAVPTSVYSKLGKVE